MIIDNPKLLKNSPQSDVTIIGSGPVGITLAIEIAKSGKNVLLLEGGAENYTEESQNRYSGEMTGLDWSKFKYMDGLRLRYLGGTSNHWVGYCLQLDQHDLIHWPISYQELYQNSGFAENILEISSFQDAMSQLDQAEYSHANENMLHMLRPLMRSPPVRFKQKYYDQLRDEPNITLCLNANLTDIDLSEDQEFIESVTVSLSPEEERHKLKIRKVIFCMGAIESTRYMLLLQKKYPGKNTWNTSLVGSNFLEHPHFDWDDPIAYCISPKGTLQRMGLANDEPFTEQKITIAITPKENTIRTLQTLNYAFTLFKSSIPINDLEKGYYSLIQKVRDEKVEDYDIHMVNLQTEINSDANNRISLSRTEVDDFGLQRVELAIGMTQALRDTLRKSVENFQRDLVKIGGVLVQVTDQPTFFMGGAHPMGTTKMGNNVSNGVTDKYGKVFGLQNTYICSGSLFPSGGNANPTFTLVCMALNLAKLISEG